MMHDDSRAHPGRPVFAALLLVSIAMLMFEILQTITLSLQTLERNAFLVVSMCLLGLGGGGSIATLMARRGSAPGARVLWWSCLAFGAGVVVSMMVSSWTNSLFSLIVLGILPYLPVGVFLSVVFQSWPGLANRLYFINLIGSALGCVLVMWLVNGTGDAPVALVVIAASILIAASVVGTLISASRVFVPLVLIAVFVALLPARSALFRFYPAPTKGMSLIMDDPGITADIEWSRWGYLGRLDVVRLGDGIERFDLGGDKVKELIDAGCDVSYLFASGGNWTKAVDFTKAPAQRDSFARGSRHSLAYLLTESPDVLNIGFGGGVDIFLALHHGARSVVGVEINPLMVRAGKEALPRYFDDFYEDPRVEIHIMDGRTYARNSTRTFDVISLTAVDTGELLHSNAHVLLENYLYTREAFDDYLRILKDGGFLYISRPHIQSMRAIATAVQSLRALGARNPADHFVILGLGEINRGRWRSVLVGKQPLTPAQKLEIRNHYKNQIAYLPGVVSADPAYTEYFRSVAIGAEDGYMARQRLDFSPVFDDRPFFYEFSHDRRHSFAGGVLMRILGWVLGIAAILIIVPLLYIRLPRKQLTAQAGTILLYFASIGMGFMFVEICLIQKLVLFLGHPSYSVTVTLFSILIFSGLGSMVAQRLDFRSVRTPLVIWIPILLAVLFYGNGIDRLLHLFHADRLWIRFAITAVLLAPGSFFMGMPFPTMIRTMASEGRALIPWAWAVNAFTSVAASVLTVYLAMQVGFHTVLSVGAASYAAAMIIYAVRLPRLRMPATMPNPTGKDEHLCA